MSVFRILPIRALLLASLLQLFSCVSVPPRESDDFRPEREEKVRDLLRRATHELRTNEVESLTRAEAYFELALELMPLDPRALDGLGCVAYRLSRFPAAEAFFRKAFQENPKYDRAIEHLALLQQQLGRAELAADLYRRAIRENPLNYRARSNLVTLLKAESEGASAQNGNRLQLLKAGVLFEPPSEPVPDEISPLREKILNSQ